MENLTELFKVKYTGKGFIKAIDTGKLGRDVDDLEEEIYGIVNIASYSVNSYSTGYFHIDITYDPELTDRTKIANEIEEYEHFDDVILG